VRVWLGEGGDRWRQVEIRRENTEAYEGALLADGFEEALIGMGHRFTYAVAVYDRRKCLDILIARDGMTDEEAEEYFSFNTEGAFMGEHTPVFLDVTP
jgi:hypothetical protein|tara:strand:+ start:572 stop:865 length:294 start_codon:yes stop_codon:yes gene_type:complete